MKRNAEDQLLILLLFYGNDETALLFEDGLPLWDPPPGRCSHVDIGLVGKLPHPVYSTCLAC